MKPLILNLVSNILLKKKLHFIITVMIIFVVIQLLSLTVIMFLFSTIRASIQGEAQWSKGQKNAVFYLREYAFFHREDDYQKYLNSIAIPLGDMRARIELEKNYPDYQIARAGLLQGRNHPDDITALILQFRYLHNVSFIQKAIDSWAAGDPPLLELEATGWRIHSQITAGTFTTDELIENLEKIAKLNTHMNQLADNYSNILGDGIRSLMKNIFIIVLTLTIVIGISCLLFIFLITTNITKGIYEIIRVSKKVANYDFSSRALICQKDEIGQLAQNFNLMADELEQKVAKEKQVEEQLRYFAQHDALTGLVSRSLLYDRLQQVIAASIRDNQRAAVFYIDIDRFKTINDTLGHEIGDGSLVAVAKKLVATVRTSDTVARIGGDEFILVFPNLATNQSAATMASKIIHMFHAPFAVDSQTIHITVSIGIAIYPDNGHDGRTLIKNADTALYKAKMAGRNNYQFYDSPR